MLSEASASTKKVNIETAPDLETLGRRRVVERVHGKAADKSKAALYLPESLDTAPKLVRSKVAEVLLSGEPQIKARVPKERALASPTK